MKTLDNTLKVHAKHVVDEPGHKEYREFTREFTLPENVDPNALRSRLSADGVLRDRGTGTKSCGSPKRELSSL